MPGTSWLRRCQTAGIVAMLVSVADLARADTPLLPTGWNIGTAFGSFLNMRYHELFGFAFFFGLQGDSKYRLKYDPIGDNRNGLAQL